MTRYLDTHSHLYFSEFDQDREAVFDRMRAAGVCTISVGTNLMTSKQAIQSARDYAEVVGATVGLHPNRAHEGFDDALFAELFSAQETPLIVAVGECGLDYYRGVDEAAKQRQQDVFGRQIEFAVAHDLPLVLHVRSAPGTFGAHEDALMLLDRARTVHGNKVRGTCHFFTAPMAVAKEYWVRGFAVSLPGVITFAKECEEVVRYAPQDLILAETDSPYAAPLSCRGGRNEPSNIVEIVERIATLRGERKEQVALYLEQNTQRIFRIP